MKKVVAILAAPLIGALINLNFQSLGGNPSTVQEFEPYSDPKPPISCYYNYTPGYVLMMICESEFFCEVQLVSTVSFKDECYEY